MLARVPTSWGQMSDTVKEPKAHPMMTPNGPVTGCLHLVIRLIIC